ncbi:MAG: hypothetical protein J6333_05375, partial [Planctomycetes bacterium]|nr:hypothetical protein [Planctomycetota bacterium]
DTARTTASEARLAAAKTKQAREESEKAIRAAREKIATIAREAKEAETTFNQALAGGGFASAKEFDEARLGEEAAAELTRERQALADRRTALAANEKEWQTDDQKLAAAPALAYTGPLAEAKTRRESANAALDALLRHNGGLQKEIEANRSAQEKSAAAARELAELQAEAGRWKELDKLIGGDANTNRFGRYAQQITVRQLVALANRELARLSPRYELRAGDEGKDGGKADKEGKDAGLELLICDQYAGGQLRPASTLSGGETFLVSLALALGLAELGGGEGKVDSLFLDEGFGTLDAATLDTALDALAKLHGAGRTIGVISHVAGLRERLPSQIEVRPRGDGRSEIFVNGVSAAVPLGK